MKRIVILLSASLVLGAMALTPKNAAAQSEESGENRSPYSKKVKGWLWLEGVAGPSAYDPDRYNSLNFAPFNANKSRGPQWGFSLGTGFGGGFFLGWYYRQGHYDGYKLARTGVEFQPTIRIPFVHVMFRVDIGYARIFDGNPWGLSDFSSGGMDTTFGVGIRIPVVRWVSITGSFDWSYVGMRVRAIGQSNWIGGQMLAGTFGVTFHFIGVRRD